MNRTAPNQCKQFARCGRAVVGIAKVIGAFLAIIAMILIFSSFSYRGESELVEFVALSSPDNSHLLTVNVGVPSTPYGSHTVEIVVSQKLNKASQFDEKFRLSNDGANLNATNIEPKWLDPKNASICLRGQEQAEKLVKVQTSDRKITIEENDC
jgi:hypothetical protein